MVVWGRLGYEEVGNACQYPLSLEDCSRDGNALAPIGDSVDDEVGVLVAYPLDARLLESALLVAHLDLTARYNAVSDITIKIVVTM